MNSSLGAGPAHYLQACRDEAFLDIGGGMGQFFW